jgi:hypothetical protein
MQIINPLIIPLQQSAAHNRSAAQCALEHINDLMWVPGLRRES